jgi:hypothetical protein
MAKIRMHNLSDFSLSWGSSAVVPSSTSWSMPPTTMATSNLSPTQMPTTMATSRPAPGPQSQNLRLVRKPGSWWNGAYIHVYGHEMCHWANTTCPLPGFATKILYFTSNHRPKQCYSCDACAIQHADNLGEIMDLPLA